MVVVLAVVGGGDGGNDGNGANGDRAGGIVDVMMSLRTVGDTDTGGDGVNGPGLGWHVLLLLLRWQHWRRGPRWL